MSGKHHITVKDKFFAAAHIALARAQATRPCQEYSDVQHLEVGIGRVLEQNSSGRDWIQKLRLVLKIGLSVSNFFAALRSRRRTALVKAVAADVSRQLDEQTPREKDPLARHRELDDFAVYAGDGHSHAASTHEEERYGKKRPVTHLYMLNLRSHSLSHLELTQPAVFKKKEHELCALKRLSLRELRRGTPTGTKVILVYDPAIVDYRQWYKWKHRGGLYILTREKENSALEVVGQNHWDKHDPRNQGILADYLVGGSNGVVLRRIIYQDPVSGDVFCYITNELTLPPGLLAFLYKCRWDAEKVFDEVKNKLGEKKAWAKSVPAQTQQAAFITLAHNLLLMLENRLQAEEGLVDQKVQRKRQARLVTDEQKARAAGREVNVLEKTWQRASQRSLQFIRWVRHCLAYMTLWSEAIPLLRPLMQHYLF